MKHFAVVILILTGTFSAISQTYEVGGNAGWFQLYRRYRAKTIIFRLIVLPLAESLNGTEAPDMHLELLYSLRILKVMMQIRENPDEHNGDILSKTR